MASGQVAPSQEFWIVAASLPKEGGASEKESLLQELKGNADLSKACKVAPLPLEVPDGNVSLRHGTFDDLNKLADDLPKFDSQVDSILHRLERQIIELNNSNPEGKSPAHLPFTVKNQRVPVGLFEYLTKWKWDESKYPKSRMMADLCTSLMQSVNRLDDEARSKTNQYNEYKTQSANVEKKEGALITSAELIDVLTPTVVKNDGLGKHPEDDFVYTDNLTTVTVILTKGSEVEFLKTYEKIGDYVVPKSAKQFDHPSAKDKDGNTVYRVVMFKEGAESFKKACRERRYITRDFEYSAEKYAKREKEREELREKVKTQYTLLLQLYQAAWSDVMVAWMHIKAMRVFAESALWSGLPPKFAAFVVSPMSGKSEAVRKALAKVRAFGGGNGRGAPGGKDLDDVEEDYPYVSLSLIPFTCPR
jgi:V-type H+-transporting ATPase subunit C